MILAAYHPCYFPSISFFAAMQSADVFVLTDDFQFSTAYDINRAKVKSAEGARWMTIPVLTKERDGQLNREVVINSDIDWRLKHLKTLRVNYTFAAYFEQFEDALANLFEKPGKYLLDFNLAVIDFVCCVLKLDTKIMLSSQLQLEGTGTKRLIAMTQAVNAETYLTAGVFRDFLRVEDFTSHGQKLEFFADSRRPYHQLFGTFVPGLSIIDLILNEGPRESINYIERFYEDRRHHSGL